MGSCGRAGAAAPAGERRVRDRYAGGRWRRLDATDRPAVGLRHLTFDDVVPLDPAATYQLAAALFDAYVGISTRETFAGWEDEHDELYDQWTDGRTRLQPRLEGLSEAVASGRTDFADAAEFACSAIKHRPPGGDADFELPSPFAALDSEAYREYGATYAVRWAEKTFEALEDDAG